jgi:cellulose synthase/poly-beta-1,6-N-acetylglucosamine synthase-like glycosyltransferase
MTGLDWALALVHGILVYSWILFPALLAVRRRRPASASGPSTTPRVAFVLSAYNEERHIGARVRNLIDIDYPEAQWRAYIGVDGARDRTAEEALRAASGHPNIGVFDFSENRGKVAVLKDLVARALADPQPPEILVFTDANTAFQRNAVRHLTAPFSDPAVGGVCGRLMLIAAKGAEGGENVYWRVENWLKARESAVDSCLGANGATYAIRAPLFWSAIPSNTIIDDFVIGMKVREYHYRMVYEPRAIAVEEMPATLGDEWKRRVRIGAGDFQAIRLCARCLSPAYGNFAWFFWSHKVLRWFTPHLMLAGILLALAGAIADHAPLALAILALYAGLGLAAWFGRASRPHSSRLMQLLRGVQYLVAMQVALFAGFLRFCRGNLEGRWQRTERV